MLSLLSGLRVETSVHLGEIVTPEMPAALVNYKGPYRQRKQRRWRREHPAKRQSTGKVYLFGNSILCHPEDVPRVVELLNTGSKR